MSRKGSATGLTACLARWNYLSKAKILLFALVFAKQAFFFPTPAFFFRKPDVGGAKSVPRLPLRDGWTCARRAPALASRLALRQTP